METLADIYSVSSVQPPKIGSNEYYTNLFFNETDYRNYSVLKLAVNSSNSELVKLYQAAADAHNETTKSNLYYNSGFDLFLPQSVQFEQPWKSQFLNLEVKAEMIHCQLFIQNGSTHPVAGMSSYSPYYLYPRSSFSKTELMLANHTGIIDAGYRGNLIAAVRWLGETKPVYNVDAHIRLFQVCHPSLCPIYVVLVDETQLTKTERGEGGFGSTKGTVA